MISEVKTLTFHGIDVVDVSVQTHISSGIPAFTLVGLADKTIAESKERVRAALNSIGISMPAKRVLINLAPADILKEGSHFDLAIACSILVATNIIPANAIKDYIVLGELSLDGSITAVSGILPAAIGALARNKGIICPKENAQEALWSGNTEILAADNLLSIINHFKETQIIAPPSKLNIENATIEHKVNMKTIRGLKTAKRAMEIAAAGGHNLVLNGAPGAGKSMIASALPSILPPLSPREVLECSMIYSVAGRIQDGQLLSHRPFRAPHHSCSMAAMIGGGTSRRLSPGEISLAHNGVLFLDEFPEFPRAIIDALRQPLENKHILISRSGSYITFPANFQLIAAMNPCRCGYLDDHSKSCNKAPQCGVDYQAKISGPILDRIDIFIDVSTIMPELSPNSYEESSETILERVMQARTIQSTRNQNLNITTNSQLTPEIIESSIKIEDQAKNILHQAANQLKLSMRSFYRIIKISQTIADLEQQDIINSDHVTEAISYRRVQPSSKLQYS